MQPVRLGYATSQVLHIYRASGRPKMENLFLTNRLDELNQFLSMAGSMGSKLKSSSSLSSREPCTRYPVSLCPRRARSKERDNQSGIFVYPPVSVTCCGRGSSAEEAYFSNGRSVIAGQRVYRRYFDISPRGRVPGRKCGWMPFEQRGMSPNEGKYPPKTVRTLENVEQVRVSIQTGM
ncbi:hypothetical protein TNCV_3332231 [Trichonephila clavipes]|nr:hypothetical protein TNCV_3332231 [Trichonephila clavipes]